MAGSLQDPSSGWYNRKEGHYAYPMKGLETIRRLQALSLPGGIAPRQLTLNLDKETGH